MNFKIGDRVRASWMRNLIGSVISFNPPAFSKAAGNTVGVLWDGEQRSLEQNRDAREIQVFYSRDEDYWGWYPPHLLEPLTEEKVA